MAKKTNSNKQEVVVDQDNPITVLRHEFYKKFNRVVTLTDDEIVALGDGSDQQVEWWFSAIQHAEEMKLSASRQGPANKDRLSLGQLLDKVNGDQIITNMVTEASKKDLPAKAPATLAYRL